MRCTDLSNWLKCVSHVELTAVVMTLLHNCMQYNQLLSRNYPTIHDVMDTFEGMGISLQELGAFANQLRGQNEQRSQVHVVEPRRDHETWENPSYSFLPSEDEDEKCQSQTTTWTTLMHDIIPDHFPPEPPRHCWMFTPVYATEMLSDMPALQLVNRKLDNARLVESSLRKLIKHTDAAAPPKLWTPPAHTHSEDTIALPKVQPIMEVGDDSIMSVDELDAPVHDIPHTTPPNNVGRHDPSRRVLPRAVNYKAAWYTATSSTDSKLPTANLYTARLRGNMDESARRTRRYIVPS